MFQGLFSFFGTCNPLICNTFPDYSLNRKQEKGLYSPFQGPLQCTLRALCLGTKHLQHTNGYCRYQQHFPAIQSDINRQARRSPPFSNNLSLVGAGQQDQLVAPGAARACVSFGFAEKCPKKAAKSWRILLPKV